MIRACAADRGLHLDEDLVFPENGRSGWQKPGGPPPYRLVWDAMIAAGKAGRFGGLLTWKLDRFARNTRDGADERGQRPNARRLVATRGCIQVDAWSAAELSRLIRAEETSGGW